MSAGFTKGPWLVRGCEIVGQSTLIATAHWHSGRGAENEADTRLIASAPDLLEELEQQADWTAAIISSLNGQTGPVSESLTARLKLQEFAARSAIARATGVSS